jgi:hypothetical protein
MTFPCSSINTLQNINLAYNQISIVNVTILNWVLIDLSSNNLTQLPYSILSTSARSARLISQRTLLLISNRLTQFDLFAYTYANTNINLLNNPFLKSLNGYDTINNTQSQPLLSGPVSGNITLPSQMRFLLNDQIPQNYDTCDSSSLINLLQIFARMQNSNVTVEIECQCSSFYLKAYFYLLNSTVKITDQFPCSNKSSLTAAQFENLNETDCLGNITLSSTGLCAFAKLTVILFKNLFEKKILLLF